MSRRWTERRARSRGWAQLAFVLALLPLSTRVDALTFLQVFETDHPHALMTVIDGGHVDLILSHAVKRPVGEGDPGLHSKSAEDHVVHIARDDLAAAQKRLADPLPAAPIPTVPSVVTVSPALRLPETLAVRAASPFSRRSVVLRT